MIKKNFSKKQEQYYDQEKDIYFQSNNKIGERIQSPDNRDPFKNDSRTAPTTVCQSGTAVTRPNSTCQYTVKIAEKQLEEADDQVLQAYISPNKPHSNFISPRTRFEYPDNQSFQCDTSMKSNSISEAFKSPHPEHNIPKTNNPPLKLNSLLNTNQKSVHSFDDERGYLKMNNQSKSNNNLPPGTGYLRNNKEFKGNENDQLLSFSYLTQNLSSKNISSNEIQRNKELKYDIPTRGPSSNNLNLQPLSDIRVNQFYASNTHLPTFAQNQSDTKHYGNLRETSQVQQSMDFPFRFDQRDSILDEQISQIPSQNPLLRFQPSPVTHQNFNSQNQQPPSPQIVGNAQITYNDKAALIPAILSQRGQSPNSTDRSNLSKNFSDLSSASITQTRPTGPSLPLYSANTHYNQQQQLHRKISLITTTYQETPASVDNNYLSRKNSVQRSQDPMNPFCRKNSETSYRHEPSGVERIDFQLDCARQSRPQNNQRENEPRNGPQRDEPYEKELKYREDCHDLSREYIQFQKNKHPSELQRDNNNHEDRSQFNQGVQNQPISVCENQLQNQGRSRQTQSHYGYTPDNQHDSGISDNYNNLRHKHNHSLVQSDKLNDFYDQDFGHLNRFEDIEEVVDDNEIDDDNFNNAGRVGSSQRNNRITPNTSKNQPPTGTTSQKNFVYHNIKNTNQTQDKRSSQNTKDYQKLQNRSFSANEVKISAQNHYSTGQNQSKKTPNSNDYRKSSQQISPQSSEKRQNKSREIRHSNNSNTNSNQQFSNRNSFNSGNSNSLSHKPSFESLRSPGNLHPQSLNQTGYENGISNYNNSFYPNYYPPVPHQQQQQQQQQPPVPPMHPNNPFYIPYSNQMPPPQNNMCYLPNQQPPPYMLNNGIQMPQNQFLNYSDPFNPQFNIPGLMMPNNFMLRSPMPPTNGYGNFNNQFPNMGNNFYPNHNNSINTLNSEGHSTGNGNLQYNLNQTGMNNMNNMMGSPNYYGQGNNQPIPIIINNNLVSPKNSNNDKQKSFGSKKAESPASTQLVLDENMRNRKSLKNIESIDQNSEYEESADIQFSSKNVAMSKMNSMRSLGHGKQYHPQPELLSIERDSNVISPKKTKFDDNNYSAGHDHKSTDRCEIRSPSNRNTSEGFESIAEYTPYDDVSQTKNFNKEKRHYDIANMNSHPGQNNNNNQIISPQNEQQKDQYVPLNQAIPRYDINLQPLSHKEVQQNSPFDNNQKSFLSQKNSQSSLAPVSVSNKNTPIPNQKSSNTINDTYNHYFNQSHPIYNNKSSSTPGTTTNTYNNTPNNNYQGIQKDLNPQSEESLKPYQQNMYSEDFDKYMSKEKQENQDTQTLADFFLEKKQSLVAKMSMKEEQQQQKVEDDTKENVTQISKRTQQDMKKQRKEMMEYGQNINSQNTRATTVSPDHRDFNFGDNSKQSISNNTSSLNSTSIKGLGNLDIEKSDRNGANRPPFRENVNQQVERSITPGGKQKDPNPDLLERLALGLKTKVDEKEMYALTKKNYENLPEIKLKQELEKQNQEKLDQIMERKEQIKQLDQARRNQFKKGK